MAAEWLERGAILGPYCCLCLTEKAFHKAFDHCTQPKDGRPAWILNSWSNATVHHLTNPKGESVAVICLRLREGVTGIQVAGLLCHEAVHMFQRWCRDHGEDSPSEEFEAYFIQHYAQQLMWSFQEQTKC